MVKAKGTSELGELHAELERLPEHLLGEILGGELVVSPRPAPRHVHATSFLGSDILQRFGRGRDSGWWIYYEPELHLGPDAIVPDLAGWRRERMPAPPVEAYFSVAPDWVCEILSPRTAASDRVRKMPIYAREGVPFLWLVDPLLHTLEVYLLREAGWLLHSAHRGEETVTVPPFEESALELSGWWLPTDEATLEAAPGAASGGTTEPGGQAT
ncbi:MAG: Uma2 family endonuclease [Polyangia bacterium]|jgi:Uma2 family endonuclease|nr:Uma2 family endonuclease [Polyangia bacterium]